MLLRLHANNLDKGADDFFAVGSPITVLKDAIKSVHRYLYNSRQDAPPVRSVTLVLKPLQGIAYTNGSELDFEHKEINISTNYIEQLGSRTREEVIGVITHEMVHCFQYNGKDTCPGWLIEGIADYVRLNAGLAPPHWQRSGSHWDEGYQVTAYFLDWLDQIRQGFVKDLNLYLRDFDYDEGRIWPELTQKTLQVLWSEYQSTMHIRTSKANATPTHSPANTCR